MNLLDRRPEQLVDTEEPANLLAAVASLDVLASETARKVDHVLRQWTMRALARQGDIEGLLELDEIAFVASEKLERQSGDALLHRTRWRAFRDLLESKRLAARSAGSGKATKLLHAGPILDLLAQQGSVTPSALAQSLGVSPGRISQILNVMEEGQLIRREKRGRENHVSLAGPSVSPAARRVVGMDFLRPAA